jgi:hypothetical protein
VSIGSPRCFQSGESFHLLKLVKDMFGSDSESRLGKLLSIISSLSFIGSSCGLVELCTISSWTKDFSIPTVVSKSCLPVSRRTPPPLVPVTPPPTARSLTTDTSPRPRPPRNNPARHGLATDVEVIELLSWAITKYVHLVVFWVRGTHRACL